MEYPIHGQPDYSQPLGGNPYTANLAGSQRNEPYMTDLAGMSTMVSDNIEMVKRLKMFVPKASVKVGARPQDLLTPSEMAQEVDAGNYKAKYQ